MENAQIKAGLASSNVLGFFFFSYLCYLFSQFIIYLFLIHLTEFANL